MQSSTSSKSKFDIAIIGAGILGVTISYWLSGLFDCSIALIERENRVAMHMSSRNTGMIHRPFYLNPDKKKIFARAAQKSYFLWESLAKKYNLSWKQYGTIEVALDNEQSDILNQYKQWALRNGMGEEEVQVLGSREVREIEPEVKCEGAIFSKTDTAVDYGELTSFVSEKASKNGVKFIAGSHVEKLAEDESCVKIELVDRSSKVKREILSDCVINAAGGESIDIAHKLGLAQEYTDLHFRGEYWKVSDPFASKIGHSVYSVARHKEFPFLDPHFIVRANGMREIGPNAVLVTGPIAYKGLSEKKSQLISKIFERPMGPKLRLFTNRTFLSLVWHEWRSSTSKSAMCDRVKQFIPSIDSSYLYERGLAGVRSSVIDSEGFVPEALFINGKRSIHILNYNSPGATGAPAFSAYVVSKAIKSGYLDQKKKSGSPSEFQTWDFENVSDL